MLKRTKKRKIGDLGESIALLFLMKQGFRFVERNYLKKWGEIDLILKRKGKLHFVEVKSVSRENISQVPHETLGVRPEENIHPKKLQRLGRTIQSYLLERGFEETDWQLDAALVYLDIERRQAKVKILKDIVL